MSHSTVCDYGGSMKTKIWNLIKCRITGFTAVGSMQQQLKVISRSIFENLIQILGCQINKAANRIFVNKWYGSFMTRASSHSSSHTSSWCKLGGICCRTCSLNCRKNTACFFLAMRSWAVQNSKWHHFARRAQLWNGSHWKMGLLSIYSSLWISQNGKWMAWYSKWELCDWYEKVNSE